MPFPEFDSILAISVGNTSTRFAVFTSAGGDDPVVRESAASTDPRAAAERVMKAAGMLPEKDAGVFIASVNQPFTNKLVNELAPMLDHEYFRFGPDLPIPAPHALGPESLVGQDRLLNGLAAYDRLKQACIVVDAGTAVTVDFIDGDGVFQGGAIAPGASMQLRALHAGTAALPEVEYRAPAPEPFARVTEQAMLQGVHFGIRGLVQAVTERFSESYGAFPLIIATGGDSETLFKDDELINQIVPDLTLRGINVARRLLADAEE